LRQAKLIKSATGRLRIEQHWFVVILVALLGAGEVAAAEPAADEAKARALFNKAESHYNQGEYSKALQLYKEAYTFAPLPGFLFNIGQCHRYLDQHHEALFFYKAYLDRFPEAPNKDDVEKLIKLSKEVVEEKRARGEVRIVKPDFPKRIGAKPAVVKPVLPKPVVVKPVLPQQDRVEAVEDDKAETSTASRRGIWLWSGLGLSSALLIASGVTGYLAHDRSEEYNDPSTPQDRLRDLKDSGETYGTASIVTAAAGGALAIVTILYYLLGPSSAEIQSAAFVPKSQGAVFMVTW
jgi:tetratricopeptide (TPR) repeat protein